MKTLKKFFMLLLITLVKSEGIGAQPPNASRPCDPRIGNIKVVYPGLSDEENALVRKHPWAALQVYFAKNEAEAVSDQKEWITNVTFGDVSDAVRHFVWAGLLTDRLGEQLARKFLEAHETSSQIEVYALKHHSTQTQQLNQRFADMDRYNNELGVTAAKALKSKNLKVTAEALVTEARKLLPDAGQPSSVAQARLLNSNGHEGEQDASIQTIKHLDFICPPPHPSLEHMCVAQDPTAELLSWFGIRST